MADTTTGQPAVDRLRQAAPPTAQPAAAPSFVPGEHALPARGERPQPAANAAPPVTPVAQLLDQLSPEQARTRLQELKSDPRWRQQLMDHWALPNSAERSLFDQLTRRAADLPAEAKVEPSSEAERAQAALEPPPSPADYRLTDFNGRPIELDEENKAIVYGKLLPAAHRLGLSQHDVDGVVFGINKPLTEDQCKAYLRRSWGIHFEERENNLRAALLADPETAELVALAQYPEQLNNNAYLWVRVEESYRRRQGKR